MSGLGQAVIDVVLRASELKSMGAEGLTGLQGELDVGDCRGLVTGRGEAGSALSPAGSRTEVLPNSPFPNPHLHLGMLAQATQARGAIRSSRHNQPTWIRIR
jgi:hypothetical protein